MNDSNQEELNVEVTEIERLIREFKEKFTTGTANVDDFLTISELWRFRSDNAIYTVK